MAAVNVQSNVQADDRSNSTRHAAAVSSQSSSTTKNNCISSTSCGSCAPLTFCRVLSGLVESQFLDESKTKRSSADVTQCLVTHGVSRRCMIKAQTTLILSPPPDAKRPSRVSPTQKSVIRCPTLKWAPCLKNVTMSKSLELREFKAGPLAKRRTTRPATKVANASRFSGCRHHRPHMIVDQLMCRVGKLEESHLKRRGVRTLAARQNHQTAPGSSASPWFAASCCRDGSLAVIQPIGAQIFFDVPPVSEGVSKFYACAHPTNNASLGRNCSTADPSRTSVSTWLRSSSACW